ncbi:FGGY-family carbohydrate kinase [Pacificispira spongiicola]|uniref:FGGY-family carbohydrate kinase n=1 Tax=Pacificispira spongiicola TaxID=2729598 RepID=UPI0029C9C2C5|nr:FGGY-family carbohydrate kinase [Pacificispira spongiicola]
MTYLLGLDAGNTVIKAVLFDGAGRQVAMHALDGHSSTPQPGHVERDLDELWTNAGTAIRACIDAADIDPHDIVGVGCAGHGNGLYLLDRDAAPLVGIQSLDSRGAALATELSASHGPAFQDICLQKPWPSQTPTLLAWMKRERPDIYARAGTVLLCKDFITFMLTGERVSDVSDMSGCGFVKLPEGIYDETLMGLYGLEDAMPLLPRLIDPSAVAGRVTKAAAALTGLAEGTPVIGGYFDVIASAIGSGVVAPGDASIIAGTWSINQVFSETAVNDPNVFMVSKFGQNRYVTIESSATSAANLEWYVREFVERYGHASDPFAVCNDRVASVIPAPDDPLFHPFLYGCRLGAEFRGGFHGVAGWHTDAHLLRALFEGVMFEHRRHIDVLMAAGLPVRHAVLSGGGARSSHWPQIFADGIGIPVATAEARETGALGAAIGAGVGTGLFPDYEAGIRVMTRPKDRFDPDPSMRDHYDRRYDLYGKLRDVLRTFWTDLQHGAGST